MAGRNGTHDGAVLRGPKSPFWGCGCGEDGNWASRIRCRACGTDAQARIRTAAQKADKEIQLSPKKSTQQQPRGDWSKGAPGNERLQKLEARLKSVEAENKRLRGASRGTSAHAVVVEDDAEEASAAGGPDPQLVQEVLDSIIKAYGAESQEAKDKTAELESLREVRRLAKPASVQLRVAERRVDRQRRALEKAKADAVAAGETVRLAQVVLSDADAKVASVEKQLQEAEADKSAVLLRTSEGPSSNTASGQQHTAASTILDALLPAVEGDAEATQALGLLRAKIAASGRVATQVEAEAEADVMDLDEEAIDSLADLITGEKLTSEDAEQRSARLEASKARLKLVRKDVATQLAGVRKRIRKGA